MVKRILLIIILVVTTLLSAIGQQPWGYMSLEEAYIDQTYIATVPDDIQQQTAGLYFNTSYRISGPYGKKIRFLNDKVDIYLPLDVANCLLPYMVSHRYWEERYQQVLQWAYVKMDNIGGILEVDTSDHHYGQYCPIVWLGYSFQSSTQWPVVFKVRTNTMEEQTLTLPALQRLAEWGAFATVRAYQTQQKHLHQAIEEQRQRDENLQKELDSLSNIGVLAARTADSLADVRVSDSMFNAQQKLQSEIEKTKERMKKEQLFLFSVKNATSDYMFGLEFNFYNCFDKTISKIEISVAPYDRRMRLQTDKFQRRVRDIRCMGPIPPLSPAQYTFDELFWDDAGKIKYVRPTSITFYFTDGTHRSFNGYERIMKHSLN